MKTRISKPHPFVPRGRPIDATGLFWSFVFVLFGCFYAGMYFGWNYFVFAGVLLLGVIPGMLWQFQIWKLDSTINRQTTEWCNDHYPDLGGTPVVDLVVAMAHIFSIDFCRLTSSTLLVDLVISADGVNDTSFVELSEMLECIAHEARIRGVDWSSFSGTTVDDAVQFLVKSIGKATDVFTTET
jgi:hypothetical protein